MRHSTIRVCLPTCLILAAWVLTTTLAQGKPEEAPVTVLAAGDVAWCPEGWWDRMWSRLRGEDPEPGAAATAALLDRLPGTVLALGDLVYPEGSAEDFRKCYEPTWGRHKERTRPTPGNHEYRSPDAAPYFAYWGERAGEPGKGYHSFDLGAWHIVALNSNVDARKGSAQERWLRADLAKTKARCILAYWHFAVFSSGKHGGLPDMLPLYTALYEAGASVVLSGHDHNYERFAPQNPRGRLDPERGIRSFVVGTGGAPLRPGQEAAPNSEVFHARSWGVLRLELYEKGYTWAFIPGYEEGFTDSGSSQCVRRSLPEKP